MLHPSACFPDYYELAERSKQSANTPEPRVDTARPERPRRNFQRIVLRSGCVLFRLFPPHQQRAAWRRIH